MIRPKFFEIYQFCPKKNVKIGERINHYSCPSEKIWVNYVTSAFFLIFSKVEGKILIKKTVVSRPLLPEITQPITQRSETVGCRACFSGPWKSSGSKLPSGRRRPLPLQGTRWGDFQGTRVTSNFGLLPNTRLGFWGLGQGDLGFRGGAWGLPFWWIRGPFRACI